MSKGNKYPYQPKDSELHLDEPLIEPSSTHPSSQASPRHIQESEHNIGNVMNLSMKCGLMAFDEVKSDRHLLKKEAIQNQNLVSEGQFLFLEELIENIPGHSTTQMIMAISLMRTKSIMYSLMSVFLFYLPTLIVTIIFSQVDHYYHSYYAEKVWSPREDFFKFYLAVLILGVSQAVVGLLLNNACVLFSKRADSSFNMVLVIVSAFISVMTRSFWVLFFVMVTWGLLCIIRGEENKLVNKPAHAISSNTENIRFLGSPALITFVSLFLILNILVQFHSFHTMDMYLATAFYRIGTFTTTGGHSLFPLALSEFHGAMNTLEVLKGFGLVSLLPGPIFNFAAWVGGVLGGVFSALLSVVFLTLPGLLILMAILPYPEMVKYNSPVRNFLVGLNLANIGFIFAAAYKLYASVALHNPYIGAIFSTLNVILSFVLLYSMNMLVPLVLLIGGGATMLYSLVYTQMIK